MNKEKLLKIINYYGLAKQLKYIHTEHFELDEACILAQITGNREHIVEELADVLVMLKQLQYYFNIEDEEVEKIAEFKIERQLKRIEEEK
jgi:NTP pyrophosphatase (non-canonical NTP hydrolase)